MRKNRKIDKSNGIVIATVVVGLALVLAIGYMAGGDGFVRAVLAEERQGQEFYFLTTAENSDLTIARQNAELIKCRGGAGYVDMQCGNVVVIAVYPDENSAKSVLEKLGDDSIVVRKIAINPISIPSKNKDVCQAVEQALTYFDITFDALYNLSNSLADNTLSIDDVNIKIGVLRSQIEDIKTVFYEQTKEIDLAYITELKVALVTCLAIIDGVEIEDYAITLSSLRRQCVQLVYCHQALVLTLS